VFWEEAAIITGVRWWAFWSEITALFNRPLKIGQVNRPLKIGQVKVKEVRREVILEFLLLRAFASGPATVATSETLADSTVRALLSSTHHIMNEVVGCLVIALYLSISIVLLTAWAFQKQSRPQQLTLCRSLHAEAIQATASKRLAQVPYVVARAGFEPSGRKASTLPMRHQMM